MRVGGGRFMGWRALGGGGMSAGRVWGKNRGRWEGVTLALFPGPTRPSPPSGGSGLGMRLG